MSLNAADNTLRHSPQTPHHTHTSSRSILLQSGIQPAQSQPTSPATTPAAAALRCVVEERQSYVETASQRQSGAAASPPSWTDSVVSKVNRPDFVHIPSTTQTGSSFDLTLGSNKSRRTTGSTVTKNTSKRGTGTSEMASHTLSDNSPSYSQSTTLTTPTNGDTRRYNFPVATLGSPKLQMARPSTIQTAHGHAMDRHYAQHTNTPSITYSRVKVMPAQSVTGTPLMRAMTADRRPSFRMSALDSGRRAYTGIMAGDSQTDRTPTQQHSPRHDTTLDVDLNSHIHHVSARMIGLKDEIQPAFRADGEVDSNYIYRKQHARREFIQHACYVFAVIYALFEVLYVITPDYSASANWPVLLIRGLATLAVVLYASVALKFKQLVEQELLEGSVTALMTVCGIALIVIEMLRPDLANTVTNDGLCLGLILLYAFTDVVLRIKFMYGCIQAVVLLALYNILMLTTYTQTVQYVLLSDAYMVLMLSGLLVICRDSEIYRRDDFANKRHLFMERRKAEALMRTMLPQQILTEYLDGRMAQISANATIGYCEIKILSNTSLAGFNQPSPAEMMQKLHDTFKRIDGIINMFAIRGVNKIETVSKTYLLCGGLLQDVDDHASAMIETALEITNMIKRATRPNQRLPIVVRFGISTGHVVGGIIGAQRRYFRVFGDTVNVAARMCMNTSIGSIQISQPCYNSLTDFQRSTLKARISEPRELAIKGKGVMSCYVVDSRDDWIPQFGKSVQFRGNLADKQTDTPLLNKSFVYHTLINYTSLHPLKMTYYGKHNLDMEKQFQANYTQTFVASIRKVNLVFIGWLIACCIYVLIRHYTGVTVVTDTSVPILCALMISIMCTINGVLYTRLAVTHMQYVLTGGIVALSAWVICTLGFWGLNGPVNPTFSMFTVMLYSCLLMRLQFRYATPIICCTVVAYLITLLVSQVHWYDTVLVMLYIVVCAVTGIITMTRFEHRIRLNFLLKYALEQEQWHMDEFLSNLLPTFVVDVLRKRNGRPVLLPGQDEYTSDNRHGLAHPNDQLSSRFSMKFKCCTVFESDIVGYTAMVGNWSADKTLNMLNNIFNLFDECASICKVEKIETIGDAFMCVVFDGQPDPVLDFSLMIQSVLFERNKHAEDAPVHIRIGVSTGSCFGGVIGTKIPRFHLFGEAHDHSILLEQNGRADECIVSNATYELSKHRYHYVDNTTKTDAGEPAAEQTYTLKSKRLEPTVSYQESLIESHKRLHVKNNMSINSNDSLILSNKMIRTLLPPSSPTTNNGGRRPATQSSEQEVHHVA